MFFFLKKLNLFYEEKKASRLSRKITEKFVAIYNVLISALTETGIL